MTVEEYQVGQLYSVADASKRETGGGDGIEILKNEPYTNKPIFHGQFPDGQYTHKIYHLSSKVPRWVRALAPKGSLEFHEEAWNAYPYCRTVITNPLYMKDKFKISIETMHLPDRGDSDNPHKLTPEELSKREVIYIDIANDHVKSGDYKADEDPTKFKSQKTGRGPLTGQWTSERRIFNNFNRQVFCWLDKWHGMTMEDIRRIEEQTKHELDEARKTGQLRGMVEE